MERIDIILGKEIVIYYKKKLTRVVVSKYYNALVAVNTYIISDLDHGVVIGEFDTEEKLDSYLTKITEELQEQVKNKLLNTRVFFSDHKEIILKVLKQLGVSPDIDYPILTSTFGVFITKYPHGDDLIYKGLNSLKQWCYHPEAEVIDNNFLINLYNGK